MEFKHGRVVGLSGKEGPPQSGKQGSMVEDKLLQVEEIVWLGNPEPIFLF